MKLDCGTKGLEECKKRWGFTEIDRNIQEERSKRTRKNYHEYYRIFMTGTEEMAFSKWVADGNNAPATNTLTFEEAQTVWFIWFQNARNFFWKGSVILKKQ